VASRLTITGAVDRDRMKRGTGENRKDVEREKERSSRIRKVTHLQARVVAILQGGRYFSGERKDSSSALENKSTKEKGILSGDSENFSGVCRLCRL